MNIHSSQLINQNDTLSAYTSRRNSTTSNANSEPQEVAPHLVKYVNLIASSTELSFIKFFF